MHPQAPSGGGLVVHTSYPALAFMLGLFSPVVTVDGAPTKVPWKDTHLPLPPGLHDVRVHVPYLWPVGKAQLNVDNRSGAPVEIYYSAPYIAFSSGAIGHAPVQPTDRTAGLIMFWSGIGLAALIILCCCGSSLLSALNSSAG